MRLTREQLKEKYKELIYTFGKECMIEQTETHYIPQTIRERLSGYKEEDDKLYLYKENYLVKGYNIRFLKNLSEEKEKKVLTTLNNYKEHILLEKQEKRQQTDDLER